MQFPDEKLEQIMNELECKTDKAECDAIARFPFSQEVQIYVFIMHPSPLLRRD